MFAQVVVCLLPDGGRGADTTAVRLLQREGGVMIVDTGPRAGGAPLVQQLHRFEEIAALRRARLSFADPDAVGRVAAPVLNDFQPAPASHRLPPHQLDASVRVLSSSGHTSGAMSGHLDDATAFFSGDALHGPDSQEAAGALYADAVAYSSSLELISAREPRAVAGGHTFTGMSAPGSKAWFAGHELRELLDVSPARRAGTGEASDG